MTIGKVLQLRMQPEYWIKLDNLVNRLEVDSKTEAVRQLIDIYERILNERDSKLRELDEQRQALRGW